MSDSATAAPEAGAPPAGFRMGNLGRHSLVYGIGMMLTKAVSFLMLPIYTRFLTTSDYGILQLLLMILEVASIFAGSRIAFGIFHYYHKAADEDGRRAVLSTALLLLAGTYTAAAVAAAAFAPQIAQVVFGGNGEFVTYVRLAVVGMAFEGLILVPTALYQLRDRSRQFVIVSLARVLMQVVLNLILLVPLDMGVTGVLLSSLITNMVVGGYLAAQMIGQIGARFRLAEAREFLRFGLPLVAMQVATFVFTFGDRWFLNRAAGEEAVGIYGLAYQFGFLVASVGFTPFQRVWDPQRFAVAKRDDRDAIYARVFIYLNVGLVSAALGISLFAGDVLRIIAAQPFHGAAVYVPIVVAAYVLHCWANFVNVGIYIREKTEYFTAANWAAAIVAVVAYVILIPRWLAWGAAIGTLLSLFVRFWLSYLFSQRLWPVRYQWVPVYRLTVIAAGVAIFSAFILPKLPLLMSIPVHALLLAFYLMVLWKVVLGEDDRASLVGMIQSRRARRAAPRNSED